MQPMSFDLANCKTLFNEYTLEGEVTIRDRTDRVGAVIFSSKMKEKYQQFAYIVLINGKKITYPIYSNPDCGVILAFIKSNKISLKLKNELIKITELDGKNKAIFYVDPRKNVEIYEAYSHQPREITLEEAKQKIETLRTDSPNFKAIVSLYNRHGVAVFGWNGKSKSHALYWASPSEKKVREMYCLVCECHDDGKMIAMSKDKNVNFQYLCDKNHYLNSEEGIEIFLLK